MIIKPHLSANMTVLELESPHPTMKKITKKLERIDLC